MKDKKLIIEENLIEDGQTIIIGISGGPDSVCLLFELLALNKKRIDEGSVGNTVVCAHINHGLRGEESDGDEAYTISLCERLGVASFVKSIDITELAKEKGLTVEEAGRESRYNFFDELCEKFTDPVIAVAHNMDDQIETVFMRIMRGTGTDGLAGMPKIRKSAAGHKIVRPLLDVPREEIVKSLLSYGETAREDSSNSNTYYFRNKIRIEVLPWLEKALGIDPGRSLLRLSENAAEDRDYFSIVVAEALDEFLKYSEENGGDSVCYLPADMLATVHPAIGNRIIRAVFDELGLHSDIAAVHLASADRLLTVWQEGGEASGKRVEFPSDYTFGIEKDRAVFRTPQAASSAWKPRRKK